MFKDRISERIISICAGISIVILSTALLIHVTGSTSQAHAEEAAKPTSAWDESLRGGVGLGIQDSTGYFVVWGSPNMFYKVNLKNATDWYSVE